MKKRTLSDGIDDETLRAAVSSSISFADLARRLGVKEVRPGSEIRRRAEAMGFQPYRPRQVSDAEFTEAVRKSWSLSTVKQHLGVRIRLATVRKRMEKLGLTRKDFVPAPPSKRRSTTGTGISEQRLAHAVAAAASYAEVARILNIPKIYPDIRQRIDAMDHSHFNATRRPATNSEFASAVRRSWSFESLRVNLGYTTGHYDRLRRRMARLNLSENDFCAPPPRGRSGARPKNPSEVFRRRDRKQHGRFLRDALVRAGKREECAVCGLGTEWQGRPLTLHVDHVNGDRLDDRKQNLRFLCPNCHTQTPTYCGRNIRKHARSARQLLQDRARFQAQSHHFLRGAA